MLGLCFIMTNLKKAIAKSDYDIETIMRAMLYCANGAPRVTQQGMRKDSYQFSARSDLMLIGLAWYAGCREIDKLATGSQTFGDWSFIRDSSESDVDNMRIVALAWLAA